MDYTRIPALLTEPGNCGTLAAARDLGRRGVRVWTTSADGGTPASKSRYVSRHIHNREAVTPEQDLELLLSIGKAEPGMVLYPTSDDFAWLQSTNIPELQPYFRMYSPDGISMENVLDKRHLFEACCAVGIDSPVSYFAESIEEVESVAQRAEFPLLLKQRTQIFSVTHTKGVVVQTAKELVPAYKQFIANNQHADAVHNRMPFSSWPLMQEFHKDAHKGSYLVSGFVNRDHTHIVAQAAVKILQYPRTLGIALCMEAAPLDEDLTRRILALCKRTGHFGVFQIEFLVAGNRKLLIDFNPRYYHYMGFDMARGIPFPWLAHLGACGDEVTLAHAIDYARDHLDRNQYTFSYRLQLRELLWAQRLTGTMSGRNFSHWRKWYKQHQHHMIDAVADPDDRRPEFAALMTKLLSNLRHPRAFIRNIALDK
ncbi:MAG: carbamoyl-phosphate synthase [Steroidobacter sp.]